MAKRLSMQTAWFRFLIVILLMLGVFFRFANLDLKVYWHDEVYTSFRIAGYTRKELVPQVFNGKVMNPEDLQKYQRPRPEKGFTDTINSLAVDDPQHPPLYYLIARLWVQLFGYSVTVIRSLSACISLLVFPCLYWLCLELFGASLVGWVAIALIAISPFHVLYAQEAREYVLWTVTILLSSAALLQAMRLQTRLSWGIYAATLALGFYSFLFTGLVAIGHGIYVVATVGYRWSKTTKAYLLASLATLVVIAPWLFVLMTNWLQFRATTGWMETIQVPQMVLIKMWGLHLIHLFIDFGLRLDHPFADLASLFFLLLVGYSIYVLCRQNSVNIWLFIVTLIGTTAIALMLPDLIFGGIRSASNRYLIPSFLGIQVAVAYLLATQITKNSLLQRKIWQIITVVLLSVGVVSCAIISQSQTSWIKVVSYNLPQYASIINQANRPILISNDFGINFGQIFALSYLLEPKVKLQLVVDSTIPNIPEGVGDVFILNPSNSLKQGIEKEYKSKVESVYKDEHNWLGKLSQN
jgi:uncharacterized membrane protein